MNAAATTTEEITPRLSKFLLIIVVLALIGLAVSGYAVQHHLALKATGATDAFCNINDTFSCDDVARSSYAEPFGIPMGVYGIGYFLGIAILAGLSVAGRAVREHLQTLAVMCVIGVIVSIALAVVSAVDIGKFCPSCMVIYGVTLLQGLLLFAVREDIPSGVTVSNLINGGTTAALALIATITIFSFARPYFAPPASVHPDVPQTMDSKSGSNGSFGLTPNVQDIPISRSAYSGLGEDYRRGGDQAKVVIVEFADFQCPACQYMGDLLRSLKDEMGDSILVVFRNYPLDSACNPSMKGSTHEHACAAAILARCAGQYGKFWAYHDQVFADQKSINANRLKEWAVQLGLSGEQVESCLKSPDILAKIKDDIAIADRVGVDGTPTVFINGRRYIGPRSKEGLRAAVEGLLRQ